MIYADEDGDIYADNGIRLGKVEYPAEVGQTSVITVRFNLGKKEIIPIEYRCSVEGKKTRVLALVDGEQATDKTYCVNNSNVGGHWSKEIDIPLGNNGNTGTFDVTLHFVNPDGAPQFGSAWRDMQQSSIEFTTEVVPSGEGPPPGAWGECDTVLGQDNCPDGYVCYEGICTPQEELPAPPDDPGEGACEECDSVLGQDNCPEGYHCVDRVCVPIDGSGCDTNGGSDPPDNGNGDGDGDGDGVIGGLSGQTLLGGLLAAGLWARSKRGEDK